MVTALLADFKFFNPARRIELPEPFPEVRVPMLQNGTAVYTLRGRAEPDGTFEGYRFGIPHVKAGTYVYWYDRHEVD